MSTVKFSPEWFDAALKRGSQRPRRDGRATGVYRETERLTRRLLVATARELGYYDALRARARAMALAGRKA